MFGQMTPGQRAENIAKAQLARAEQAAHNKANEHLLKLEYMDSTHWQELASKYKVRLPTYNVPADAKGIRKMLKKCDVSNDTFKEHYTGIEYFLQNNSRWTLAAVTGIILELREGLHVD